MFMYPTSITTITTYKGMIFKLVLLLMGLIDLVVTIGCPPRLGPKVDDDAPTSMCWFQSP